VLFRSSEGIIRTFGYSEETLLFNFDIWKKWIHPDDSERVIKNLNYHLKNQLKNWQDEYRFKAADDSYKDVFSRGYLLFNKSGKATRMFGSTTDVTERKTGKRTCRPATETTKADYRNHDTCTGKGKK